MTTSCALAAAACYSPELRDCTLTCNTASDCADGQVCGPDQFCASAEIAGTCRQLPPDAGGSDRDAGVVDAQLPDARPDGTPPPDAAMFAVLKIKIDGKGRVTVQGIGMCDESGPQNGDCEYSIAVGTELTLTPTPYPDWRFDRWMGSACAVESGECTFTFNGASMVEAKFRKDWEDDD